MCGVWGNFENFRFRSGGRLSCTNWNEFEFWDTGLRELSDVSSEIAETKGLNLFFTRPM